MRRLAIAVAVLASATAILAWSGFPMQDHAGEPWGEIQDDHDPIGQLLERADAIRRLTASSVAATNSILSNSIAFNLTLWDGWRTVSGSTNLVFTNVVYTNMGSNYLWFTNIWTGTVSYTDHSPVYRTLANTNYGWKWGQATYTATNETNVSYLFQLPPGAALEPIDRFIVAACATNRYLIPITNGWDYSDWFAAHDLEQSNYVFDAWEEQMAWVNELIEPPTYHHIAALFSARNQAWLGPVTTNSVGEITDGVYALKAYGTAGRRRLGSAASIVGLGNALFSAGDALSAYYTDPGIFPRIVLTRSTNASPSYTRVFRIDGQVFSPTSRVLSAASETISMTAPHVTNTITSTNHFVSVSTIYSDEALQEGDLIEVVYDQPYQAFGGNFLSSTNLLGALDDRQNLLEGLGPINLPEESFVFGSNTWFERHGSVSLSNYNDSIPDASGPAKSLSKTDDLKLLSPWLYIHLGWQWRMPHEHTSKYAFYIEAMGPSSSGTELNYLIESKDFHLLYVTNLPIIQTECEISIYTACWLSVEYPVMIPDDLGIGTNYMKKVGSFNYDGTSGWANADMLIMGNDNYYSGSPVTNIWYGTPYGPQSAGVCSLKYVWGTLRPK